MKKKKCLFLVPGQSGSNLFLFLFSPHIHSAATFCLKATLSQEHSLRPLLSDQRRERWRRRDRCHLNNTTERIPTGAVTDYCQLTDSGMISSNLWVLSRVPGLTWTGMSKQEHGRRRCPPGFAVDQKPPVMRGPQSVGRHQSRLPGEEEER